MKRKKTCPLSTDDSPENYIMMYLTPVEDSGLTILPTHRLVLADGGLKTSALIESMSRFFDVEEIKGGSREILGRRGTRGDEG